MNSEPAPVEAEVAQEIFSILARSADSDSENRAAIPMDDDGDIEVVVRSGVVEIRLPTVFWDGPYNPIPATRLWHRESALGMTKGKLTELFFSAREARRDEFQPCCYCGKATPPEHRHGEVCHGCSERELGIVH